jgi:hypothetical protein
MWGLVWLGAGSQSPWLLGRYPCRSLAPKARGFLV